jgi:hypothetical protein
MTQINKVLELLRREAELGPKDDLHCIQCRELFSPKNTHTEAGWRETKISGFCEDCFDGVFQ